MTPEPGRPIPVRELLKGGSGGDEAVDPEEGRASAAAEGGGDPAAAPSPGSAPPGSPGTEAARQTIFPAEDGVKWRVRVTGSTRTGHGNDAGAILLSLEFREVREPERAHEEAPDPRPIAREILAVARTLEDLGLEELRTLLVRARPKAPGAEEEGGRSVSI